MKAKILSTKDLRAKKTADLDKYVIEMKQALADHHYKVYTNEDNKTHQLAKIKKAIAVAKTVQRENRGEGA